MDQSLLWEMQAHAMYPTGSSWASQSAHADGSVCTLTMTLWLMVKFITSRYVISEYLINSAIIDARIICARLLDHGSLVQLH